MSIPTIKFFIPYESGISTVITEDEPDKFWGTIQNLAQYGALYQTFIEMGDGTTMEINPGESTRTVSNVVLRLRCGDKAKLICYDMTLSYEEDDLPDLPSSLTTLDGEEEYTFSWGPSEYGHVFLNVKVTSVI